MRIKNLFYFLFALPLFMVACEDEPPQTVTTPDPSVTITPGDKTQTTLGFVITVKDAERASWMLFESGDVAPTAQQIIAEGVAIDVTSPTNAVANDLTPDTEYCIIAAAVAGEKVVVSEVTKMRTLAESVDEEVLEFELTSARRDWESPAPKNSIVLRMSDEGEQLKVILGIVMAEGDKVLKAGTYSTAEGEILENSYIHIEDDMDPDTNVTFFLEDGEVVVAEEGGNYNIELNFYDAQAQIRLHGTFNGEIADMEPVEVNENQIEPDMVQAVCFDEGNFGLYVYFNNYDYHYLNLVDRSADANIYYLNSGPYSSAAGTVNLDESEYTDETGLRHKFTSVELELTINDDQTVTIAGSLSAANGDERTINWTGKVSGFNFEIPEEPTEVLVEFSSASFQSISSYGDAAIYQFRNDNGYQANIYFERSNAYPIKPGSYDYVSGYVNYGQQCFSGIESSFTLRDSNNDRVTGIHATSGYISVEIIEGEYLITFNLELDYLGGTDYTASYHGLITNDTVWIDPNAGDGEVGESIAFTKMSYKEYNMTYYCDTFTLSDDVGNSLDLIVYDDQANETFIYESADFVWSSYPWNYDEFTTQNISINGVAYTAIAGDMQVESDSSTGVMSITLNLSFDDGSSRTFTFDGSVTAAGGDEGGDEGGNTGGDEGGNTGGDEGGNTGGDEPFVGVDLTGLSYIYNDGSSEIWQFQGDGYQFNIGFSVQNVTSSTFTVGEYTFNRYGYPDGEFQWAFPTQSAKIEGSTVWSPAGTTLTITENGGIYTFIFDVNGVNYRYVGAL